MIDSPSEIYNLKGSWKLSSLVQVFLLSKVSSKKLHHPRRSRSGDAYLRLSVIRRVVTACCVQKPINASGLECSDSK